MGEKAGETKLVFLKSGHYWFDSGLVGLIKVLEELDLPSVIMQVSEDCLSLSGQAAGVQMAIEQAYNLLVDRYYNLSTKKQKDDTSNYNFYYDSKKDCFVSFPKRKPAGIAAIICDIAPRPTGSLIKWKSNSKEKREIMFNGKKIRRNRYLLPDNFAHLQQRMDQFLDENGLDVTTSGLLVDGPNSAKPKVKIPVVKKGKMGTCYLCGGNDEPIEEANQTIFPFITGASGLLSFNSEGGKPEKICWKCSLLGKFVPVNGFYLAQDEHIYTFLPYSVSLDKMCTSYTSLQEAKYEDPNLYRNFNHPLGSYYYHSFEVFFAFLYTLYEKLLIRSVGDSLNNTFTADFEEMFQLTLKTAPLEFYVIHTKSEGSTFAGKMVWPYRDTVYFFRLIQAIEDRSGSRIKEIFQLLVDYNQQKNEYKTLVRNRVCERILKKQPILELIESFVFQAGLVYIKPLIDLTLHYELLLKGENQVFKEEQEAAVALGRRIGAIVGESPNGKKGDLYALRKSRIKTDFLEQINRLQFKLGSDFIVPPEIYEGKLNDDNFLEFKQFCMIAALNSFNAKVNKKNKKEEK